MGYPLEKKERFAVLDGLRGMAAVVVLIFHLIQQRSINALPYAGLSVDFFYVLSGFVVAFAYEKRLQTDKMSIPDFFSVRVKRLYPLIFLGTGVGIAFAILASVVKKTISTKEIFEAGALGLLVLPSFVITRWPTAYPFNMASWSLTFEAFVNIIYGLIAKYLSNLRLIILIVLAALALIWLILENHGVAGGNNQKGWAFGFIRVMFPFFIGVLLYRFRPQARLNSAASMAMLVGLSVMLLADWPNYTVVSASYVLILFPIVVFVGAALQASPQISKFCTFAGALSYPIYILQAPVLRLGEEVLKHYHPSGLHLIAFDMVEGAAVILTAWLGLKFFDEPVQKMLRGRIAPADALPMGQRP